LLRQGHKHKALNLADALLPLEMVYAFEPVPPEAPPPLGMALDGDGGAAGCEAAPMSPTSAPSAPGDSDADMECSAADGCGL
jgi:hypothetical protein